MTVREQALALFQKVRKLEIAKEHNGLVRCPYCGKWLPVERAVAVHYISRQYRSTEVEPMNVWAGCSECNSQDQLESGQGYMHDCYRETLINTEGVGEWGVKWLENRKHVLVKHGTHFYQELIIECKKRLKELEA